MAFGLLIESEEFIIVEDSATSTVSSVVTAFCLLFLSKTNTYVLCSSPFVTTTGMMVFLFFPSRITLPVSPANEIVAPNKLGVGLIVTSVTSAASAI